MYTVQEKILRKTIGNYSVPIPTLGVGGRGCRVEDLGFRVYVVGVASLQKTLSIWGSHLEDINLRHSIWVPLKRIYKGTPKGSFKGSMGLGFRVEDINPALPITRSIP